MRSVEDPEEQERTVQVLQETCGQRAVMHGHRRRCRILPTRPTADNQPDDGESRGLIRTTSGNLRGARATRLDHPFGRRRYAAQPLIGRPDLCRQVQNERGCTPFH
ncbi:hypothetical protein CDAR_593351 [Caerostris darwini]|nr:hypothetical protein CDAR_593351 [Caerostris darwini]